ncbi:MAG: S9 family peptidase, partial [Dehalococcoidia bacterium]
MATTVQAPWRQRYRGPRITVPVWASDVPQRLRYLSTEEGKTELVAWDRARDHHRRVTDRPEGTTNGRIDPTGEWIWWFADERG